MFHLLHLQMGVRVLLKAIFHQKQHLLEFKIRTKLNVLNTGNEVSNSWKYLIISHTIELENTHSRTNNTIPLRFPYAIRQPFSSKHFAAQSQSLSQMSQHFTGHFGPGLAGLTPGIAECNRPLIE